MRQLLLLFTCLLVSLSYGLSQNGLGQSKTSEETSSGTDIQLPDGYLSPSGDSVIREVPLKKLNVNGYYRFFGYGRTMTDPYPNLAPFESAYGVGDGYREPMLSLMVSGRPNGRSSFATELFMLTPYDGTIDGNVFTMNLGLNFYGNFRTDYGKFGVRAGGIHWYAMSSFTMGLFQVVDGFSNFDRTPWEGVTGLDKYDSYYQTGSISRDLRWNNRAFQGVILEGGELPGNVSFAFLFGKAQANGGLINAVTDPAATVFPNNLAQGNVPTYVGFAGQGEVQPNTMTGFRLKKDFSRGFLAYNTLYSRTRKDSIVADFQTYNIHTLEYEWQLGKARLSGEIGAGNFKAVGDTARWGEALMVRLQTPRAYTGLPFELQLYQIGKNFYNDNGEIQTFSNPKIQAASLGPNQVGQPSAGGILGPVGQLVHNRRGVNLITRTNLGPVRLKGSWGFAAEMEALSNELSYVHRINGLALSRLYNPFPAGATGPTIVGPYQRVVTFFRGAYEVVQTTDLDPATANTTARKFFPALDVQAKYKTSFLKKDLYFFYLGSWMSASNRADVVPLYNPESTYIHAQYHEFDLYYELFPKFILTGYYGLEFIRGGLNTEWDAETLQPRNQIGQGFAYGFDWTLAENAGLYVRHRLMRFNDRSFGLDNYQGHETTIELKVFF
ncbi:MAG: hypothetical protein AAF399_12735 [Bacteroidota bacterium]